MTRWSCLPQAGQSYGQPSRVNMERLDLADALHSRYVSDNPGAWLLHCHLQWHLMVSVHDVLMLQTLTSSMTERDGIGAR